MRRGRRKLFWLLLIAVTAGLFFTPGSGEEENPLIGRVSDGAHFPAMLALTVCAYFLVQRPGLSSPTKGFLVGAVAAIVVLGVELIQPYVGRSASAADVIFGLLGVVTGSVAAVSIDQNRKFFLPSWLLAVIIACGVTAFRPAWFELQAEDWRQQHFPVLGEFEDAVEMRIWRPEAGDDKSFPILERRPWNFYEGRHALQVTTQKGSYSGIRYLIRQDWSGFRTLSFAVFNPGRPFRLSVRIDDTSRSAYDDRFNKTLDVATGWTRVEIPLDDVVHGPSRREINLAKLRQLLLFTGQDEPERVFFLDDVRLNP